MNILDYIILGLLLFFLIKGIFRGFFREISSLAGIVFGIVIANKNYLKMAGFLKDYITSETYLPLISFIILFIGVIILFTFIGAFLHFVFKKLFMGWLDRSLGLGLSFIKGIIVSYLVIVLIVFFLPSKSPLLSQSRIAHLVTVTYQSMVQVISPGFYDVWKKRISSESKKIGKIISEGKKAAKNIPHVIPEKKK